MPLFPLLLFSIFLLRQGLSCLTNAPFYGGGSGGDDDDDDDVHQWNDDPVVPDWKLIKSDFSSIVLVMNNYTFTCSGRINEWYYWWILKDAVPNCEIIFTLYVMRRQPSDGPTSFCNATVVGYSRFVLTNAQGDLSLRPYAYPPREDVGVKPGDFIAFQIELGNDCLDSTAVWLRGKQSSNTVYFKLRSQTGLALNLCAMAPFDVFHDVLPFVSANVEPTSETTLNPSTMSSTQLTTGIMKASRSSFSSPLIEATPEYLPSSMTISSTGPAAPRLVTSSTINSRRTIEVTSYSLAAADIPPPMTTFIPTTPSATAAQISSLTIATPTTGRMAADTQTTPTTTNTQVPTTTVTTTTPLPPVDTLQLAPPTATPTTDSLTTIVATADIQGPTTTNTASLTFITVENILLLVIVGSLVLSVVMLGACLMAVTIYACKHKSSTQKESGPQQCTCDSSTTETITATTREPTHEYDYINSETGSTIQECVMEHNLAYNKSPNVFTTYI